MPRKVLTTVVPMPREEQSVQVEVTLPVVLRRHPTHGQAGLAPHQESHLRIPRITRLMALAIKFHEMVSHGEVQDYADLARLGYVTRARVTQIMNLLLLAPDIQETILLFSDVYGTPAHLTEPAVRSIAAIPVWQDQRDALENLTLT